MLLATEIVHGYNKKNVAPSVVLKVDLRKAFDSVRWDFIISTLKAVKLTRENHWMGSRMHIYCDLFCLCEWHAGGF